MRGLKILLATAFLAGTAGTAWPDAAGDAHQVNPQPLPPDGNRQAAGNPPATIKNGLKGGKEVLVGYEEGNPDKPIVTGQSGAKGPYYYFKHTDSGQTLIPGNGNNAAVTAVAGKNSSRTAGKNAFTNGSKGALTGNRKIGLNRADSFKKANGPLTAGPNHGTMDGRAARSK